MNCIAEEMENIRKRAIMEKTRRHTMVSELWKEYFMINESFVTMENMTLDDRVIKTKAFDYGYCLTTIKVKVRHIRKRIHRHKEIIKECKDKFVRRELEYVTFSRTKNDVNIFQ